MALTDDAHRLIEEHFLDKEKHVAIDATCGNGNDTVFLALLGFDKVVGFDIQELAIEVSRQRLEAMNINNAELILDGHQHLAKHIDREVCCVMFNFGYLPGADKNTATESASSLCAIKAACDLLSRQGMISLMCYPGTDAGAAEHKAILNHIKSIGPDWKVETHLAVSPKPSAPILYVLKRST